MPKFDKTGISYSKSGRFKWTKKDVEGWINMKVKKEFEKIPFMDHKTGLPIQIVIKKVIVEFKEIQ